MKSSMKWIAAGAIAVSLIPVQAYAAGLLGGLGGGGNGGLLGGNGGLLGGNGGVVSGLLGGDSSGGGTGGLISQGGDGTTSILNNTVTIGPPPPNEPNTQNNVNPPTPQGRILAINTGGQGTGGTGDTLLGGGGPRLGTGDLLGTGGVNVTLPNLGGLNTTVSSITDPVSHVLGTVTTTVNNVTGIPGRNGTQGTSTNTVVYVPGTNTTTIVGNTRTIPGAARTPGNGSYPQVYFVNGGNGGNGGFALPEGMSARLKQLIKIMQDRDYLRVSNGRAVCLQSFGVAEIQGWLPKKEWGNFNQIVQSYSGDVAQLRQLLSNCRSGGQKQALAGNINRVITLDIRSDGTPVLFMF